ncbi:hypothetical protein EG68_05797, partial [Paragonimus skrjabini miyazakii]
MHRWRSVMNRLDLTKFMRPLSSFNYSRTPPYDGPITLSSTDVRSSQLTEVLQNQPGISTTLNTDISVDEAARQSLLAWCRSVTAGYPGVFVRDFSDSWRDGRAFLAILHRYRPELIDFQIIDRQSASQNLELAFNLALRELQVARLFDAEDLATITDERSIMTYVASLYESLVVETPFVPPMPPFYPSVTRDTVMPSKLAVVASSTAQSTNELNSRWTECRTLAIDLAQWLRLTTDQMSARNFPPDLKLVQQRVIGEIKRHRLEERPRRERERQQLVRMYEELKPAIRCGKLPNESFLCIEQINRLWGEYDLALQERELAARSEAHRLDRLQWAGNRATRECKAVESQLVALERHVPESNSSPADLTDGQPGRWNEQLDVVESKLNGLFNQVQHLRTGRYVHTEQIYRNVCTLHQRFLDLKRRVREQITSHGLNGTKIITQSTPSSALNGTPPSAILQHTLSGHGDQKYEFLTPIQRCLAWIDEHTRTVINGSYGNTLKAVEEAARRHEHTHREVKHFQSEIERCRANHVKMAQPLEDKQLFEEALRTMEDEYQQLLIACDKRARFLHSLMDFVRLAEQQLLWIRDCESREVSRDWSHHESQLKSNELRTYLHGLMQELKQHEITFSELSVVGSSMILDNHPAVDLVQAYLSTLERHWAWLFQLLGCTEARLEQLSRRETLYEEAAQCEASLNKLLDNLRTQFGPSHRPPNKTEAERLRKQLQLISVQVDDYEKLITQLIRQAQELLPLTLADSISDEITSATNSPDQQCVGLHVHPLCCFRSADYWLDQSCRRVPSPAPLSVMGEAFWPVGDEPTSFDRSDSLILVASAGVNSWKLRTPNGTCLQTPTVCFLPSWPCSKAIERTKQLASLVNNVKSCLALVDLHLKGQLLRLSVNDYRQNSHQLQPEDRFQSAKRLYVDHLRHLLALRLANQPASEIDQFETDLNAFEDELRVLGLEQPDLDEETNEQHRQLVDHLRQVLDTLTCRLQQSSANALPNRVEELELQIQQHKAWAHDLSRVRAQCLDFDQLVTSSGPGTDATQATTLPSIAIQSQALCDAVGQLHIAGQTRARLLADADAWLARLADVDQVLTDCELRLFGCAVHAHGLLPSDGTLEVATHDGLRAMSVEQAHKDLKAVAERLPRLRTELDLLAQQLPDLSKLCSLDATTDQSDSVLLGPFVSPVNTQLLDANLAVSHRRLAMTMREVEQELKLFGDSLRHFSAYQSLHEQLTDQLTQLARRAVGIGELARSVGLESGPDHSLTHAALVQAEEVVTEVDSRLEQVEALNQHVTQLVSVLTSYAQLTQTYRHLVETTFQKSGGYRDYRWSPGFGLFDLPQVLKNVDQITDQYNSQAQYMYDQVHNLYQVIFDRLFSVSAALSALLASGICVEFRDSRVSWYDSKGPGYSAQSSDLVKPCLSDWLTAGAYNPVTGRLRVSVLKPSTSNSARVFSEDELTIQRAIDEGLIDPNIPEIVVPMDSSLPQAASVPYRRITLAMSISLGLLDQHEGMWRGIAQWADVSVGLESAYAAGLISRAPTLSEAVLSGLLNLFTENPSGDLQAGLIDAHTGDFLSIGEAVQRGLLLGSRLSLMLLQDNKVAALTLNEALDMGLLNEFGQFVPPDKVADPMSLWDAVNFGLARLIHTEVFPPPVGILQPKTARNQQYHQHPIIQAIRTNLLDASSERILLSEPEARQLGLTPEERRVPLRNSPWVGNLCDAHSVHLLTASSGLSYSDGRELTGLDALARGWLKPCSNTSPGSKTFGELIDPSTDLSVDVNNGSRWPPTRPLSTSGAHLLLGLSSNRPDCGYLVTRRLITKLTWLGPGLHDDTLIRPAPRTDVSRVSASAKPNQALRIENIVAVIDPISGNRLTPNEAVGQHLLDLDLGLYRDPVTGQASGINEAVHNGRILVDRPNSSTSAENVVLPADLSMKETRTYRIVSVMDPVTGQLVSPDRAIAAGLLDLRSRLYTGTQPSISIDEARQRGFVLAHGISQATDWTPELGIMTSDETKSSRKPPSLIELIHTGRIIQHPDKRCLVHVPAEARFISLEEAVSIGQLDPDRSLVKNSSTGLWCNLPKAFSSELVDGISGYVNLMPGWISVLDAATRGLLSESTSSSLSVNDGPISFDDALDRGLIDPASSQFRRSSVQSGPCDPTTVSVQEAIERGWLESPAKQKKFTQNGSPTSLTRKRVPSPGLMSAKTPLSSLRKLFRSQSPGKISTLSDTSDGMDTSFRSGRVESSKPERSKSGSTNRFLSLFSILKPSQTDASSNQGTLRKSRKPKPHVTVTSQERNCVLYAFYYLHDEVRVEAAITDTMLREGRVNLRNATVCHPLHGRFVPVSEALTNGFVFGIVFTRAERVSQLNVESELDAAPVVREPVFWLEVFHHRHDIYQLERVYDPYDKRLIEVEDALNKGIIDPIHCTYTHPVTGDLYSIEDALYCGWIQALPVGNPPPLEPERNTFDHIHVRTVEEGFTFTTITRTIPLTSPMKTGRQSPPVPIQSNGVRTTMSLKRHLPGEPLPQFHPTLRTGVSQPVYHLKPGFQFTQQGDIQDTATKNRYSIVEAIARNFAVPVVPGDQLPRQSSNDAEPQHMTCLPKHPRFSPNLFSRDVRYSTRAEFDPSIQIELTDNSTAPVLSLSLVRYQQSFNVPTVQGQPKTWLPRYITLETATKRGWLDPVTGQLHTQSGRTTKIHLLEAVEQGIVDPVQILVRFVQPMESDLQPEALYGDEHVTAYYSLATVLEAATYIYQTAGYPSSIHQWRNNLMSAVLGSVETSPIIGAGAAKVRVEPSLSDKDYEFLEGVFTNHNYELLRQSVESVDNAWKHKLTKLITADQAMHTFSQPSGSHALQIEYRGTLLPIAQAIELGLLKKETPIVQHPSEQEPGIQYTAINNGIKLVFTEKLHANQPRKSSIQYEIMKHTHKDSTSVENQENKNGSNEKIKHTEKNKTKNTQREETEEKNRAVENTENQHRGDLKNTSQGTKNLNKIDQRKDDKENLHSGKMGAVSVVDVSPVSPVSKAAPDAAVSLTLSDALAAGLVDPASGLVRVPDTDRYLS